MVEEKDTKNYLAKVVGKNKDDKPIVKLYRMSFEGNSIKSEGCDIEEMDWDIAKKVYSVVGVMQ